jgi:DNA-binding transcriptional MerR regulator
VRPSGTFSSGELARLTGVSTDTLRGYERRGLLPRPRRAPNGYREYPPEAALRVRLVQRALSIGFTLDELRQVFNVRDRGGAPCREVRSLAGRKLELLEQRIEELVGARDRLQEIVGHWDVILSRTPQGARASLLEALDTLVEPGQDPPHVPPPLRRRAAATRR